MTLFGDSSLNIRTSDVYSWVILGIELTNIRTTVTSVSLFELVTPYHWVIS